MNEPEASILVLQQLVAAVERAGVPSAHFLEAIELDPQLLAQNEARLPMRDLVRYGEVALDLTDDPALGLHWAEWLTVRSFNLVTQLLIHASSLRHAFETLFQFRALVSDEIGVDLIERDDTVELRCAQLSFASPRMHRMTAEVTALGFVRVLGEFDGQTRIHRVAFDYPAPSYRESYTRVFEGRERFEQPFSGLVFDRALLDLPARSSDTSLQGTLRRLAEQRVSSLKPEAEFARRVHDVLITQQAPQRVTMKHVAKSLHVSERSLTRRLAREGHSFRAISHEAAALVAKRLLVDEGRTVQDAAAEMGFSDAPAFHRAFKGWTGTTPTKFRDRAIRAPS